MPRVQSKSAKRAKSPVNNQYLEKKSSLEIFKISYTSMQKIKFEWCLHLFLRISTFACIGIQSLIMSMSLKYLET